MDAVHPADRLEVIDRDGCLQLLADQDIGRVGFLVDGRPRIEPVTYGLADDHVIVSSRPGAKLDAALAGQTVAFEVDSVEEWAHAGWSVLVVGPAQVITDGAEIARLRAVGPHAWASGPDNHWIRIATADVSGRRVRSEPGGVSTIRLTDAADG